MPLDPKVAQFIQEVKDAGAPAYEEMTPAEARAQELQDLALANRHRQPEAVARVVHSFIPGPTADLPVRIYYPIDALPGEQGTPALIFIHGSGWVVSNIETNDHFSRALANRTGMVVIAVNYQKAPEHKFPIPMDDCYAATLWVFEQAQALGLDARRIGIMGDSAGGNLAAAVTLRLRDEMGPLLAFQVLVYPALHYGWDSASAKQHANGYLLQRDSMKYYWHHYIRSAADGQNPYCSPLDASSHSCLPPALIYTAEYDPLCDDGFNYAQKLKLTGVPVSYKMYDGMIHGFIKMLQRFEQASDFLDDLRADLRPLLGDAVNAEVCI